MSWLPKKEEDKNHDLSQPPMTRPTSCNCNGRTSCVLRFIRIMDEYYLRDTTEFDVNEHCHDCGIPNRAGHTHHGNCDVEICPRCGGQMLLHVCEDIDDTGVPDDAIMLEFLTELPKGAVLTPARWDRKKLMQSFPERYNL